MNRLQSLFTKKPGKVLSIYFTAGYPTHGSTIEIMQSLEQYGADIIELGIPYSDPLADGPVIQESSFAALENGMTIPKLFDQLKDFRKQIHVPVILMGYLNPVLQYGFEKFLADAAEAGIDGVILPDLPDHEFQFLYSELFKKYSIDFIFLVTPETSDERIDKLDQLSSGFLYAVSSSSVTGSEQSNTQMAPYLKRLKSMHLKNPVLAGFGIRNREDFITVCQHANGAIIGSAFIKALKNSNDVKATTKSFLSSILSS